MKKLLKTLVIAAGLILLLSSCGDYVSSLDPFIDVIGDDELNDPSRVEFLIRGVKQQLSYTVDDMFVNVAGLSDEFIFDLQTPTAVFPQFEEIDKGNILLTNYQIENINTNIGLLRLVADDLIARLEKIDNINPSVLNEAKFVGYFYGGLARYFGATYLGLDQNTGGACIDNSEFIPSNDLYDKAVEKMKEALPFASNDYEKKVVNSAIAKAYLYKGDYNNAATYAAQGLVVDDEPFQALYTAQDPTYFDIEAGSQRHQYTADPRFQAYLDADPNEASRIPLSPIQSSDGTKTFYIQLKYPGPDAPINIVSWQENNLIMAELALRGFGGGDAAALINAVRVSHGLNPLESTPNLDTIYKERDKELFLTGARLPDQRRFDQWHLGSGTWKFIPIDQRERDHNPNL